MGGAILGAFLLVFLSELAPIHSYEILGYPLSITIIKLLIGLILILIGLNELAGVMRVETIIARYARLGD